MKRTRSSVGVLCAVAIQVSVSTLALPAAGQSHMDKALFLELANTQDSQAWGLLLVNLKGVLAGLEAANMALVRRGDDTLYCPPPDAAITPDWAADEMLAYLKRYPSIPDSMSIAVIASFTLAEVFPCETGT